MTSLLCRLYFILYHKLLHPCSLSPLQHQPTGVPEPCLPLRSPSACAARSFSSAVVLVKSCFTWNS